MVGRACVMGDVKDPVAVLLDRDGHKEEMLRGLGLALGNLADVVEEYRSAWKSATGTGWAKGDLVKAGFVDPLKLPRGMDRLGVKESRHQVSPASASSVE